jgi:arylsulfatase A-like enzyme
MIRQTTEAVEAGPAGFSNSESAPVATELAHLCFLAAWFGLAAGLLEVSTILLRKRVIDPDHLYRMSRHFVWLIPVSNLSLFLALALLSTGIVLLWPRRGRWVIVRLFCALAILPALLVAFPRIHAAASMVLALGLAARLAPVLERRLHGFRWFMRVTFPVGITVVLVLGGSIWFNERSKMSHELSRPLPAGGSPNVLLIVLDTVAASHLGLHGYSRATSMTLDELADRGIQFDSARASSSWTLPSHASMFTGRPLHELSVGWLTPLDGTKKTLAEFLGERGYATAGFVANTFYCATDSGLARGFVHYDDFIFPELTFLKTAVLVQRALEVFQASAYFAEDWLRWAAVFPYVERLWQALDTDRKDAPEIGRELLGWLSERAQPERPFFAFLNYYDAHHPYQLPTGRLHRFGIEPTDDYQRILIQQWGTIDKTTVSPAGVAFAVDAYDDCIADLDEQLGTLIDELDRRGVLGKTWLVITSDHGESFGEHPGIFSHGLSLYETELHVPLLIIPPGGTRAKEIVKESVSLSDLAMTVVEFTGQQSESPFPGVSLSRFWKTHKPPTPGRSLLASPPLAEVVPNDPHQRDYWGLPRQLSPLASVKQGEWSYIRRQADGQEELFRLPDDPKEQRNLASDPSAQDTLARMRADLDHVTAGPLSPERFKP